MVTDLVFKNQKAGILMKSTDLSVTCGSWLSGQCSGPFQSQSSTTTTILSSNLKRVMTDSTQDLQKSHTFKNCQKKRKLKAFSRWCMSTLAGDCYCDQYSWVYFSETIFQNTIFKNNFWEQKLLFFFCITHFF